MQNQILRLLACELLECMHISCAPETSIGKHDLGYQLHKRCKNCCTHGRYKRTHSRLTLERKKLAWLIKHALRNPSEDAYRPHAHWLASWHRVSLLVALLHVQVAVPFARQHQLLRPILCKDVARHLQFHIPTQYFPSLECSTEEEVSARTE